MTTPNEKHSQGYEALWNIINTSPTLDDYRKVLSDIGGHDDRIAAVHKVASLLAQLAARVEEDCDQQVYEHEKDAERYGDNPVAGDHRMSAVWYAIDAHRMANYSARVEEAHERDEELAGMQESLQEEFGGKMTEEQAKKAMEDLY